MQYNISEEIEDRLNRINVLAEYIKGYKETIKYHDDKTAVKYHIEPPKLQLDIYDWSITEHDLYYGRHGFEKFSRASPDVKYKYIEMLKNRLKEMEIERNKLTKEIDECKEILHKEVINE